MPTRQLFLRVYLIFKLKHKHGKISKPSSYSYHIQWLLLLINLILSCLLLLRHPRTLTLLLIFHRGKLFVPCFYLRQRTSTLPSKDSRSIIIIYIHMLMLDSIIINTISSRASDLCLWYVKFIIFWCYLSITFKGHYCQCQRFVIDVNILCTPMDPDYNNISRIAWFFLITWHKSAFIMFLVLRIHPIYCGGNIYTNVWLRVLYLSSHNFKKSKI